MMLTADLSKNEKMNIRLLQKHCSACATFKDQHNSYCSYERVQNELNLVRTCILNEVNSNFHTGRNTKLRTER